jgi:hypothetical protein
VKEAAQKAAEATAEKAKQAMAERREAKDSPPESAPAPAEPAPAAPQSSDPSKPLFTGKSHESGRNATVTLYRDRIERVKEKSFNSFSRAAQDTEVTPVRAVSSVQAKKDGFRTNVTVFASGNNIDFRFEHAEAQAFKDALLALILGSETTTPAPAAVVAAEADPMEQLRKLGELRDAGLLTQEEFDAKKAELLRKM